MYKRGLLFIFLSMSFNAWAQQSNQIKITGKVVDSDSGRPLSKVICKLLKSDGELIDYTLTNDKGEYIALLQSGVAFISFSHLGYKKQIFNVQEFQAVSQIALDPEVQKIDPVIIHPPPIQWKRDTLIYRIDSFKEKQDRYLTDVLKKLPGITVSEDGTIAYQGKAISRFYIEGQDLMGNHYNQATQSIPVDAISQVQVLENHQHVKALKNIAFTDKAALNVRLKNGYKMKGFGEASTGAGTGTKPFLWDDELFLMKVKAKNQLLFTGKMNNTGDDLSNETKEHIDLADWFSYEPLPKKRINTITPSTPLDLKRYLKNQSITGGLNNLIKLSNDSNLRLNVLYYKDKTNYSDSSYYQYGKDNPVTFSEKKDLTNRPHFIIPQIQYEHNAENLYVMNNFKTSWPKNTQNDFISSNDKDIKQESEDIPQYLQNTLKATLNKNSKVYSFNSFIRYYKGKEELKFERERFNSDTDNAIKNFEKINKEVFFTKNRVSTNFLLFKQRLDFGLNFSLKKENFSTFVDESVLSNRYNFPYKDTEKISSRWKSRLGISPGYDLNFPLIGRVNINLPVYFDVLKTSWARKSMSKEYISYAPSITLNRKYGELWDLSILTSYEIRPDNAYMASLLPIFQDYRTVYQPSLAIDQAIDKVHTLRLSSSAAYHDLAALLFMNITGAYSKTKRKLYTDYMYTNLMTEVRPLWGGNHTESFSVNGMIDKTFSSLGLSFKCIGDYSHNKFLFSQNGNAFYNSSNALTGTLTSRFKKYSWFLLTYTLTGHTAWQDNSVSDTQRLSSTRHQVQGFIFPTPRIKVNLSADYSRIEITKDKFKEVKFLDMEATYAHNKQIEFRFRIANLLNQKDYHIATQNGLNYSSYYLPLRGRELLIKMVYRF